MFIFEKSFYLFVLLNVQFCCIMIASSPLRYDRLDRDEKDTNENCNDADTCSSDWDIDKLVKLIENENQGHDQRSPDGDIDFTKYHTYQEISQWMVEKAANNTHIATTLKLGTSWEGRPLLAMKISEKSGLEQSKPGVWLDAGIHSDEWIAPATLLYIMGQLLNGYNKVDSITRLVDNYSWYFVPVVNVDGYVHTWTEDRFWRKTRSQNDVKLDCVGVDANRNWDFKWKGAGDDLDTCGGNYPGSGPASEPEVKSIQDFLLKHNHSIKAYLTYHSFGQQLLLPYAYSIHDNPSNIHELQRIAKYAVEALSKIHGTKYRYGKISKLIGQAYGSSVDWAYSVAGIKYAFGIELRDSGQNGLLLHPKSIVPNGEESFEAVKKIAQFLP